MKLILGKIFQSPLSRHLQSIYALEKRGAFLLADRWKIVLLHANGDVEPIWQTSDEDIAYKWRGTFDDRLSDELYIDISETRKSGFRMLGKEACQRIESGTAYYGHDEKVIAFQGKSIVLLSLETDGLVECAKTKTKGKDPVAWALHPHQNTIIYGTNYGELYAQPFEDNRFEKPTKIDVLPNTCYQIEFSTDGTKMFVAGLGYVKVFDCNEKVFSPNVSLTTAVRSFELVDKYLFLNKGMHGIDVLKIVEKPERVVSLDLPFSIDKMYYLASQRAFLLISSSTDEWALLTWVD